MLFLSLIFAGGAFAQSVGGAPEAEYGRVTGGEINLTVKNPQPLSGSIFMMGSQGSGRGYGATLGGTIVPDKMWFFGSVQQSVSRGLDTKLTGQLGERQNLTASFATAKQTAVTPVFNTQIPSSFLTLHYTGIVSDNMFVTASFSKQRSN